MIIISRNVKGLGSWKKRAFIMNFLKSSNPSIVIPQETKSSSIERRSIKSLWSSLFIGWSSIDVIGTSGDILIMLNELFLILLKLSKVITLSPLTSLWRTASLYGLQVYMALMHLQKGVIFGRIYLIYPPFVGLIGFWVGTSTSPNGLGRNPI